MIKNLRPVDGSEQRAWLGEGGWGVGVFIQGKPCLSLLITAHAACVALLFHVAIRTISLTTPLCACTCVHAPVCVDDVLPYSFCGSSCINVLSESHRPPVFCFKCL